MTRRLLRRAYLRPTVVSDNIVKFSVRTYAGTLALAVMAGSAFFAVYTLSNRILQLYFLICGMLCLVGAACWLFWRDDLEIDVNRRSYVRRRGFWPSLRKQEGSLNDITAVEVSLRHPQDSHGGQLDVWTVGLRFKEETDPLSVAEFLRNEQRAREFAQNLAVRLHIALSDSSSSASR
jgi:hypothetical protein